MTSRRAEVMGADRQKSQEEEVDLWWGSYAGRAMVPSFALCIFLTLAIYLGARWWVREQGWMQLAFSAVAGAVWLMQIWRWCRRFFTWNYRLTTRYLYVDRGWYPLIANRILLRSIAGVHVRRQGLARLLGIGDIVIWFDDTTQPPAVLVALTNARNAAETIREAVSNSKEFVG